ncbi:MAG: hypothetical protein ACPG7R_08600, partial [Planctomycetota bacterium]
MIKKSLSKSSSSHSGFVLPLVIVVGFILVIGGMTLVARSFNGLIGSVRQQKSRQAREAAEIGLAVTMEALNGRFGYLMINCYPNPLDSSGNATGPYFDFTDAATPIQNSCLYTGGWGLDTPVNTTDASPEFPSSLCPGSRSGTPLLSDTLTNPNTRYRIDYYAFNGTEFYGGKGTLQVTGEVLNHDQTEIVATSTIRQTFNVITEPCGGFPGLLMIHDGDLGNNDILGLQSGNVHCVGCTVDSAPDDQGLYTRKQLEEAIGARNRSEITGNITIGPLSFPPVPQFPSHDANCREINGQTQNCYSLADHNADRLESNLNGVTIEAITIGSLPNDHDHDNSGYTITAGSITGALNVSRDNEGNYINTNNDSNIKDFCVVLPEGDQQITHCLIDNIELKGQDTLRIDSSNGPVRLYFKGKTVNASGQGGIEHVWDQGVSPPPPASRLGLFGIRTDEQNSDGNRLCASNLDELAIPPPSGTLIQEVQLSGGGGFSHLFGYFPCGITGINGGSGGETVNGVCKEAGDMNGAIWTAYWGLGLSNSDMAELCVPDNMVDQLRYFFGSEFALSVRRYRAQG